MVYTVEIEVEYEEDFGGSQFHWELEGVFASRRGAEQFVQEKYPFDEHRIKEWTVNDI